MRKLQLEWHGYFPMDEKTIRGKVEDRSGVYKLSRKQKDGSLKPFCTGQAASLKIKLLEHLTSTSQSCIKEQITKGDCQFKLAYVYTKEDLDAADKALYKRYTPKCTEKESVPEAAEDVEVNSN